MQPLLIHSTHSPLPKSNRLWESVEGMQPLITMEDLQIVEHVVRKDKGVIEQCGLIGIPPEDMHKVYCDRMLCHFPLPLSHI